MQSEYGQKSHKNTVATPDDVSISDLVHQVLKFLSIIDMSKSENLLTVHLGDQYTVKDCMSI